MFYPLGIYKCRPDITKACSHSPLVHMNDLERSPQELQEVYKVLSAFSKSQKSFYFQVNPLNFAFSTPWEQQHTRVRYWSALFRNGRSLRVIIDISMHNSSVMARPKERNERNSSKNAAAMVKCSALMTSHVSFQSRFPSYIYDTTNTLILAYINYFIIILYRLML